AWSPDGSQIACSINRAGAYELALLDAQSGQVQTLRAGNGVHALPNWSPDGRCLTVEYEDPILPPDLYKVEVENGRTTQLTFSNLPALAANPLVMPEVVSYKSYDGLEIPAFLYRPAKSNGAAVVNPHGGPSSLYNF